MNKPTQFSMKIENDVGNTVSMSVFHKERLYPKKLWEDQRASSEENNITSIYDMLVDMAVDSAIPFDEDIRITCADDDLYFATVDALKISDNIESENFRLSDDDELATLKKRARFHEWQKQHKFCVM